MAEVVLEIGGRSYTVACRDGGEEHLRGLGRRVDAKVAEARGAVGSTNEVRQLLFAALLLADELLESSVQPAPQTAAAPAQTDPELGRALNALAERIERIADSLETEPAHA